VYERLSRGYAVRSMDAKVNPPSCCSHVYFHINHGGVETVMTLISFI
jgi:hypothetical protein